jgi:epoxyqueuosine reductase
MEPEFSPRPGMNPVALTPLFDLDEAGFRQLFRDTPLWRAKRRGVLRNAAIVLGNQQQAGSLAALAKGLDDVEPLVRGACAWALGQYQHEAAQSLLARRATIETDKQVLEEINASLWRARDAAGRPVAPLA